MTRDDEIRMTAMRQIIDDICTTCPTLNYWSPSLPIPGFSTALAHLRGEIINPGHDDWRAVSDAQQAAAHARDILVAARWGMMQNPGAHTVQLIPLDRSIAIVQAMINAIICVDDETDWTSDREKLSLDPNNRNAVRGVDALIAQANANTYPAAGGVEKPISAAAETTGWHNAL